MTHEEIIKQHHQERVNAILNNFDTLDYNKVEESLFKSLQNGLIGENSFIHGLNALDIIKARHGVYKDTYQNKKLHRVGMPYGKKIDEHDHIGKTKSGKYFDIRRKHDHEDYKDFSEDDHKDVAEKHKKYLDSGNANDEEKKYHTSMIDKHSNKKEDSEIKNDKLPDLKPGDIYEHSGGKAKIKSIYDDKENNRKMVSYKHIDSKGVSSDEEQTLEGFNNTKGKKIEETKSESKDNNLKDKIDYFKELSLNEQEKYIDTLENKWIPEAEKNIKEAKFDSIKNIWRMQIKSYNNLLSAIKNK